MGDVIGYMARDQYGNTEHGLQHPRKDPLERAGVRHAEKMFVDGKDGQPKHIGYVISGHWWTVYKVASWVGV